MALNHFFIFSLAIFFFLTGMYLVRAIFRISTILEENWFLVTSSPPISISLCGLSVAYGKRMDRAAETSAITARMKRSYFSPFSFFCGYFYWTNHLKNKHEYWYETQMASTILKKAFILKRDTSSKIRLNKHKHWKWKQ